MNWLFLLAIAASACAPAPPAEENAMPTSIPPRDGDIAIQQELDAARRAGTTAAYDLFIARHPRHPLIEIARRERARIVRPPRP